MMAQTDLAVTPVSHVTSSDAIVRLVTAEELTSYRDAWQRLADRALVPNVFYEPWMALPALAALENTDQLRFLLVFDGRGEELWGFIPLEIQPRCLHLPFRNLALWQHRYCYLTAPLLDAAHSRDAMSAFWQWLPHNPLRAHILDTNWLLAEGAFHALWTDVTLGRTSLMLNDFPRAIYRPDRSGGCCLAQSISKKSANRFRHRERQLSRLGVFEYRAVEAARDVEPWVEAFLKLESAGWKGRTGGRAFANYHPDSDYFLAITTEAFNRGRAILVSLTLDGSPIAMRHTLLAGHGAFAFRTAYDELYAKFSPGTLLELEVMRRIGEKTSVEWMDSCAEPRHVHWTRFYHERRMLRRSMFSCGSAKGDFLVSVLPLLRWAGKLIRPTRTPDYLQISTRRGD